MAIANKGTVFCIMPICFMMKPRNDFFASVTETLRQALKLEIDPMSGRFLRSSEIFESGIVSICGQEIPDPAVNVLKMIMTKPPSELASAKPLCLNPLNDLEHLRKLHPMSS